VRHTTHTTNDMRGFCKSPHESPIAGSCGSVCRELRGICGSQLDLTIFRLEWLGSASVLLDVDISDTLSHLSLKAPVKFCGETSEDTSSLPLPFCVAGTIFPKELVNHSQDIPKPLGAPRDKRLQHFSEVSHAQSWCGTAAGTGDRCASASNVSYDEWM
jgi:hypothetical protein